MLDWAPLTALFTANAAFSCATQYTAIFYTFISDGEIIKLFGFNKTVLHFAVASTAADYLRSPKLWSTLTAAALEQTQVVQRSMWPAIPKDLQSDYVGGHCRG